MKKLTAFSVWMSILFGLLLPSVYAAEITLNSRCGLADAILAANSDRAQGGCRAGSGADTITLSRDITLDGGLPKITSEITIEGGGYTISGDNRYRIFFNDGGTLTIHNLRMIEGSAEDESGGAIINEGELSISGSSFGDNSADEYGGAIANGGELSISNSSFSGNSAESAGGAIANAGELSINGSSFSGNSAEYGSAIYNWGELVISSSSFSGNSAESAGGAIYNGKDGELSISESSFSGNVADSYGGAIGNLGELSIINSIIAGGSGDACYSEGRLKRNIHNFIEDGSCSPAFRGDPGLGALVVPTDGSPAYYPLLEGSRAIDAGDNTTCSETDQIGTARPQGPVCDIGAYEYVFPLIAVPAKV